MGAEWWIGQHHIKSAFVEAVDVYESVMVMDTAMTVAMHDHIHFARASSSGLGIGSIDAVMRDPIETGGGIRDVKFLVQLFLNRLEGLDEPLIQPALLLCSQLDAR